MTTQEVMIAVAETRSLNEAGIISRTEARAIIFALLKKADLLPPSIKEQEFD